MEQISLQIPARLYAALYQHYGERTSAFVESWLEERVRSLEEPSSPAVSTSQRYPRPNPGTKTGRVWEIADSIEKAKGVATREDVIRACMEEGLNVNTASTQYSYWKSAKS